MVGDLAASGLPDDCADAVACQLWLANLDAFRAEIGEAAAAEVEDEAHTVGPQLGERHYLVVVARKPPESSS